MTAKKPSAKKTSAVARALRQAAPDVRAEVNVHQDAGFIASLSRTVKLTAGIVVTVGVFSGLSYWLFTNFESTAHATKAAEDTDKKIVEQNAQAKKELEEHKKVDEKQIEISQKNLQAVQQGFEAARLYGDRRDLLRAKKDLERKLSDSTTRQAMKIKEDPVAAITRKRDEQDMVELNQQITVVEALINQMRLNLGKDKP